LLEGITFILDAHGFELHKKVTSPRWFLQLCQKLHSLEKKHKEF
jgi:hypothetical protein